MKKTLLSLFLLSLTFYSQAQTSACAVTGFSIQYKGTSTNPDGTCNILVDLYWDQQANNGNKYSYFHIWQSSNYQKFDYTNPSPSRAPMASDLSGSLGTIIIESPSSDNPTLFDTYNPDPSYSKVITSANSQNISIRRVTVDGQTDRFIVQNVVLRNLTCNPNGSYQFTGDIWSSQQANGNNVHCNFQGISFAINEVVDRSLLSCIGDGSGNLAIQLLSMNPSTTGTYRVYVDNTHGGMTASFDAATDLPLTGTLNYTTSSSAEVSGAWPYRFVGPTVVIPSQYRYNNLWIVVTSGANTQVFAVVNPCSALPASLKNFSADRVRQTVALKWQTVSEQGLKGFDVQRNINGVWKTVGFVQSKSVAGNSNATLHYEFTEANGFKGVSQYRLQEVSLDARVRLSEIKSVRGEELLGRMTIYPNPSTNGRVNITFDNNNIRDINVIDASGRTVRQLKGVTNTVTIENLQNGYYNLQVVDRINNEITTDKLIIKMR